MRSSSWLGSLVILGLALGGCAAPADDAGTGAAAATAGESLAFVSATYGDLQLVVNRGELRGSYFTSIGDPAHGGATCSFTFSGRASDHGVASVTATDGYDHTQGALRVLPLKPGQVAPDLVLTLTDSLNACSRIWGDRPMEIGDGERFADMDAAGWAPVRVDKTYFYDAPGSAKRAAYVMKGDIVTILAAGNDPIVTKGFVHASFTNEAGRTTTGYLSLSDLDAPWAATGE